MPLPFQRRGGAQLRPTFSRDFAGLKTLDHGVGPAITFTRASNATFFSASGVLQTASNDQPRFDHDPETGASRGLLIEEERTNLLERSAEFENAYWSKSEVTIAANDASAPSATSTADKVYPSNNSAAAQFSRNLAASASTSYSASVFLKAAGKTFGYLQINLTESTIPTRAFFFTINLSDGAVGTQQNLVSSTSGVTASAVGVGSGWYRLVVNFTTIATTNGITFHVGPCDAANSRDVTASGTNGILAWGAQLEAGAFPTSYIPTTNADATRSADSAVVTPISSFYNQSEGTLFAQLSTLSTASGTFPYSIAIDNNTNDNRVELYGSAVSAATTVVSSGTPQTLMSFAGVITARTAFSSAVAFRTNDLAFSTNGQTPLTDATVILPVGPDRLRIKPATNGHIRKIAYYPRRLSNTLLQQLTT